MSAREWAYLLIPGWVLAFAAVLELRRIANALTHANVREPHATFSNALALIVLVVVVSWFFGKVLR